MAVQRHAEAAARLEAAAKYEAAQWAYRCIKDIPLVYKSVVSDRGFSEEELMAAAAEYKAAAEEYKAAAVELKAAARQGPGEGSGQGAT